ncbi:sugar ABC transporter substrate-binding protein [Paenibacillus sp. HB172176]|uniref:ABC transporter substrate-binding protein n=1 Tax=Paenibacillus sp. HB172176 TaxID=2493690 RepID=UPI00143A5E08|nr:sugar ABC transporter substrate-binding protein [Paenibacillus sp. HB172176]
MNRKTAMLILALTLTSAAALGGCGSKNEDNNSGSTGSEKAVLQYYTWTDEEDYMKKIVDAFNNAHSDIEVKLNTISNNSNEYSTRIMNNLTGGSRMDVFSINGTADLGTYASKNQLVDLSDRVKSANMDVGAYGPSFQDITDKLTGGVYYALPYRTSQYALFYNKKLFDEADLPYPEQMTWDEYADLAKQLTKGEGSDKQWGGYFADWLTAPLGALQSGSSILDDNLDPEADWLSFLNRIYYDDNSHMSYKQMKAESTDWIKQFEVGNVAMLVNGEWTLNMLQADIASGAADIDFDMAPLPLPAGVDSPITVGGVSTFIGINQRSEHQDAAFEFVKFVAGEEGGSMIADSSVLPAYSSDGTKSSFLQATGIQGSGYFFDAKTVVENQPIAQINEVNRVFSEQRDLYLFQQQDLAKTIDEFEKARQSVLEQ